MSRSGYSDDGEYNGLWRGAVAQSIRGKKGQTFLREALAALDELPEKILVTSALEENGNYCLLGAVGRKRNLNMGEIDPEDSWVVSEQFGISHALACEIVYMNDEVDNNWRVGDTPSERFERMRKWVKSNLIDSSTPNTTNTEE